MSMAALLRRFVRRQAASPPSFALIVPDEMTGLDLVDGVGFAFACSRDLLAAEAREARSRAREEDDRVRRAYLAGRADALTEAVARTDTAMENLFAR